ncbi:hypothetical protein BJ875DRAFT_466520 [Amylocarpus encephaloides]|uniref:Histone-lysine N-methyltransferase, H3 lysine-36 specific n=1 Tax=Amylocarpus encephaloides TaxID=45428 RepID=A0A9P7YGA4_9HELO|nr:hypothetical protein BJ875DRAFT_466520 [Amylocarpus encephaloides]
MADDTEKIQGGRVDAALGDMRLEKGESSVEGTIAANGTDETDTSREPRKSRSSTPATKLFTSQSPVKMQSARESSDSNSEEDEDEEVMDDDIPLTAEPGSAPKRSRRSTQKAVSRPRSLFNDMEDVTEEASSVFQVIKDCIYGSRYMGSTEHDTLDCDCSEEWRDGKNHACGDDSDCINRATKMECTDDCNCGRGCENQRFLRRRYANVSVFKTEKKGYGLRANTDLNTGDFVFEYIGEVINEPTFRRRMVQYDQEGVKHFYFMSLTKNEFVDATKKGNLGRFCNHSCNPNCFVDKWVVGEKLRMGIFAERPIQKGEELVFNYNVDRYGAEPVPCYCAELNCTGFIGGRTQTERATNLSNAVIAALGIDDGNGWDTAVAKKPRKKKSGENDEEYINNVQPRGLDEDGVRKVMAALMQCKEKWLAVKFLHRIQRCDDDRVRNKVVQMHGYQILRTTLTTFQDDDNVILQVLDILYKLPRLTRNKISDSKIEAAVSALVGSEHEDVAFESRRLIEDWSKLEVAYRIPRKKWDPNAVGAYERRPAERPEEVVKSAAPTLIAPTGPKNSGFQRAPFQPRPPPRRIFALPTGWYETKDERGNTYYYSKAGQTTWQRPYHPAAEPPPPPKEAPKSVQAQKALNDIIQSIVAAGSSSTPTRGTTTGDSTPKAKEKLVERWRSYSEEKQMKMYENTLFPHIKHVMQKFSKQLPKEDLKKFAKEVGKKLVASDFKNKRVEDPTKISEKQEKKVKQFVREYFEKAVEKRKAIEKRKQEKLADGAASSTPVDPPAISSSSTEMNGASPLNVDEDADTLSLHTPTPAAVGSPSMPPATPLAGSPDRSRKRTLDEMSTPETDSHKRLKEEGDDTVPTPPPPPPPPADMGTPDTPLAEKEETEEERELRLQEEDLMRENEEAMMMDLDGSLGYGGVSTFDVDAALASRNKPTFESNAVGGVNGKASNGSMNGNGNGNGPTAEDEKMEGVETSGQAHDREEAV